MYEYKLFGLYIMFAYVFCYMRICVLKRVIFVPGKNLGFCSYQAKNWRNDYSNDVSGPGGGEESFVIKK